MPTTDLNRPPDARHGVDPGRPPDLSDAAEEAVAELGPLVGAVPGEGPPILLLAGPLVLFALALTGPFLLLLTLAALLVACGLLVALVGAVVVSPYLLVRRLGRHRLPRAHRNVPVAHFVPVDSGR
jgi:hypothetical protein